MVSSGLDVTERKQAEAEVRASRARIVQAGDAERRRLERNLHDGAQQRLVALSLGIRMASARSERPAKAPRRCSPAPTRSSPRRSTELRELARGIHPAVLTDRGLSVALEALAGRATLPVDAGGRVEERLPEPIEAAPTTSSRRLSRTSRSTRRRARLRSACRCENGGRPRRGRRRRARRSRRGATDQGCGASQTGSKRSTGASRSRALRARHPDPGGDAAARPTSVGCPLCGSCSPTTRSCSARASRGCSPTPASTSSGRPATPTSSCSRSARTRRMSRSSTSACRRRRPTRACKAAHEIREKYPGRGVLVLSQYVEPGYALELLSDSAEGVGYLLKDRVSDVSEFADAVRRVGEGGICAGPDGRLAARRPAAA